MSGLPTSVIYYTYFVPMKYRPCVKLLRNEYNLYSYRKCFDVFQKIKIHEKFMEWHWLDKCVDDLTSTMHGKQIQIVGFSTFNFIG